MPQGKATLTAFISKKNLYNLSLLSDISFNYLH